MTLMQVGEKANETVGKFMKNQEKRRNYRYGPRAFLQSNASSEQLKGRASRALPDSWSVCFTQPTAIGYPWRVRRHDGRFRFTG